MGGGWRGSGEAVFNMLPVLIFTSLCVYFCLCASITHWIFHIYVRIENSVRFCFIRISHVHEENGAVKMKDTADVNLRGWFTSVTFLSAHAMFEECIRNDGNHGGSTEINNVVNKWNVWIVFLGRKWLSLNDGIWTSTKYREDLSSAHTHAEKTHSIREF